MHSCCYRGERLYCTSIMMKPTFTHQSYPPLREPPCKNLWSTRWFKTTGPVVDTYQKPERSYTRCLVLNLVVIYPGAIYLPDRVLSMVRQQRSQARALGPSKTPARPCTTQSSALASRVRSRGQARQRGRADDLKQCLRPGLEACL